MTLKIIEWECTGRQECLWQGTTKGFLSNTILFVSPTGIKPDEYLVWASNKNITKTRCIGLENAKDKAQDLLNGYAISLSIF